VQGRTWSPPTRGFLSLLLLLGVYLAAEDLGFGNIRPGSNDETSWVYLHDPDQGGRFLNSLAGQPLGDLLEYERTHGAEVLLPNCGQTSLSPGASIRLIRRTGTDGLDCRVSTMPERFRYLLGLKLNINRATQEELTMIPGIGRTLAERITVEREKRGAFLKPEDLLQVHGIGPKVLKRILDHGCTESSNRKRDLFQARQR